MVRYLVSHGANIEYMDHAMRNALYWSVYNNCAESTVFLLKAGAKVKPWLWLEDEGLPISILEDRVNHAVIREARSGPATLKILARSCFRHWLMERSGGSSIFPLINQLPVGERTKNLLRLNDISNLKTASSNKSSVANGKAAGGQANEKRRVITSHR